MLARAGNALPPRALALLPLQHSRLVRAHHLQAAYATASLVSGPVSGRGGGSSALVCGQASSSLLSTLQPAATRSSGRRSFATAKSESPLYFDTTHHVVKSLQEKGFTAEQSEAMLDVMKDAMADSLDAQSRILATKSEHVELKAELSERVFNSTLKFDIAQRHSRELLERDFNTLKQDIRMLEKIDFDKIRMEIAELEKKFLLQKQAEDETLNELRLSMEKVEKRMLQYAVGFAGTIMAVGAALMRLVM